MDTVPAIPTLTGRPARHATVARDTAEIMKRWLHDRVGGAGRANPRARTPLVTSTQQVRN
jgi:hypothetical protein